MYRNSKVTGKLSVGQKRVLRLHEALYLRVRDMKGDNSLPVRNILEKLLQVNLADETRDAAVKNFILATHGGDAKKYICRGTGYNFLGNDDPQYAKENLTPDKQWEFTGFGSTEVEAFEQLMKYKKDIFLCNKTTEPSPYRATVQCTSVPTIRENCRLNQ